MNIVILNYEEFCVDKYTNLPLSWEDDIESYIVNDLGYKDKEIAWLVDEDPIKNNLYYWTKKDGVKKV